MVPIDDDLKTKQNTKWAEEPPWRLSAGRTTGVRSQGDEDWWGTPQSVVLGRIWYFLAH